MASRQKAISARPLVGSRRPSTRHKLRVDAYFSPALGLVPDVFDTVAWKERTAAIKDESGKVIFEQQNVGAPETWSDQAVDIVASKYFYGENGTATREKSVKQLIHRVTRTIADWGIRDGYFATKADGERFYRELTWLCLHQHMAFNSPVWFNVGIGQQYGVKGGEGNWSLQPNQFRLKTYDAVKCYDAYQHPQGSACFIQSVEDNMQSIMALATAEAMLFKHGSGTGTDLSTLRSSKEKLSGGGRPSGPLSFMRVYDQIAGVIKSGGKTRRAAKMQSLLVSHPDILEFIRVKHQEEKKAHALIAQGYESNFNGEAYSSVFFQNANLSVRVTDEFMQAVAKGERWATRWVTDPTKEGPAFKAESLFYEMAEAAWKCGDPGIQYHTTINNWNTCPKSGEIRATNPCSEYSFLDDTACNLASINLMKFREPSGAFDYMRFHRACATTLIAQDILVHHASYPTEKIAANSAKFRPLGLGYANLGSLIMASGLAYDSAQARTLCGLITATMHGAANLTSARMAKAVGAFPAYVENGADMLRVMQMHADAVEAIIVNDPAGENAKRDVRALWAAVLDDGRKHGFRNAQATVLAPTGTISFLMDCDTTGIEPDLALVKYKSLAGRGTMKIVNRTVPLALKTLGYNDTTAASIIAHIEKFDTIEDVTAPADENGKKSILASWLQPHHLPIFDCAFKAAQGTRAIDWHAHLSMMAAAQPFLSGAISKTVNMPADATVEEIAEAYRLGWELGLKAVAVYRDGCKMSQPLNTKKEDDGAAMGLGLAAASLGVLAEAKADREFIEKFLDAPGPFRQRLPVDRDATVHKFSIAGHEGYLMASRYPDGRLGEIFLKMAKEGSTMAGLMDCLATVVSIAIQYGVPLEVLTSKFVNMRFEPNGFTENPEIRMAKSIPDYVGRWLNQRFGLKGPNDASGTDLPLLPDDVATSTLPVAELATVVGFTGDGHMAQAPTAKCDDAPSPSEASGWTAKATPYKREVLSAQRTAHAFQSDAPICPNCGTITEPHGKCHTCPNCATSLGCS